MTTKDYKLIASVLREAAAKEGYEISTLVEMFAGALQRANPNFDSERFARAVWAPREPASRTQGKLAQRFASQVRCEWRGILGCTKLAPHEVCNGSSSSTERGV